MASLPDSGLGLRRPSGLRPVRVFRSERFDLGDPAHLEIVSDMLSTDAVKVKPGSRKGPLVEVGPATARCPVLSPPP